MVSHTVPQLPQLLESLVTSTQVPLHAICGDAQTGLHLPVMHWGVLFGHALPHSPQLFQSIRIAVHLPLQLIVPAGHWHLPAVQTWVAAQTVPQAPQLTELVCRLVQAPLQIVWLLAQVTQLPAAQVAPVEQV